MGLRDDKQRVRQEIEAASKIAQRYKSLVIDGEKGMVYYVARPQFALEDTVIEIPIADILVHASTLISAIYTPQVKLETQETTNASQKKKE